MQRQAREHRRIIEDHQRLLREEAERERQREAEKLQVKKEGIWYQETSNWQNKLARNLVFKTLATLKQQAFAENWNENQISQAVAKVKQEAELQASEKQKKFANTVKIEVEQIQKAELIKTIESSNLPQAQSAYLKQRIEQLSGENLLTVAKESAVAQDESVEKEEVRKEMVKAVYQALKESGFNVLPPVKQVNEKGEDIVLVQAA